MTREQEKLYYLGLPNPFLPIIKSLEESLTECPHDPEMVRLRNAMHNELCVASGLDLGYDIVKWREWFFDGDNLYNAYHQLSDLNQIQPA